MRELKRINQWQSRLDKVITDMMATPLTYSTNDCMTLAIRTIKAVTGENILDSPVVRAFATDGLPEYRTEDEANQVIADFGFANIEHLLDAVLVRKRQIYAVPGDLVQHPTDLTIIGVLGGDMIHFLSMTDKPATVEAYSYVAPAWDVCQWVE